LIFPSPHRGTAPNFLDCASVVSVGVKHGRSAAQVLLRFVTAQGGSVIPKSRSIQHMKQNRELDFSLDKEDLESLRKLDSHSRLCTGNWFWNGKSQKQFWDEEWSL